MACLGGITDRGLGDSRVLGEGLGDGDIFVAGIGGVSGTTGATGSCTVWGIGWGGGEGALSSLTREFSTASLSSPMIRSGDLAGVGCVAAFRLPELSLSAACFGVLLDEALGCGVDTGCSIGVEGGCGCGCGDVCGDGAVVVMASSVSGSVSEGFSRVSGGLGGTGDLSATTLFSPPAGWESM